MNLQQELAALWIKAVPIDRRTRRAYRNFVRSAYQRLGLNPFRAEYDEAGNCKTCGESGRCPGWHFDGETP